MNYSPFKEVTQMLKLIDKSKKVRRFSYWLLFVLGSALILWTGSLFITAIRWW